MSVQLIFYLSARESIFIALLSAATVQSIGVMIRGVRTQPDGWFVLEPRHPTFQFAQAMYLLGWNILQRIMLRVVAQL